MPQEIDLAQDSEESKLKRLLNQNLLHLHFPVDKKNLLLYNLAGIPKA